MIHHRLWRWFGWTQPLQPTQGEHAFTLRVRLASLLDEARLASGKRRQLLLMRSSAVLVALREQAGARVVASSRQAAQRLALGKAYHELANDRLRRAAACLRPGGDGARADEWLRGAMRNLTQAAFYYP